MDIVRQWNFAMWYRYLGELLEADRQLLAQGQRRVEIQQSHRQIQERRLTLQRRAGQVWHSCGTHWRETEVVLHSTGELVS